MQILSLTQFVIPSSIGFVWKVKRNLIEFWNQTLISHKDLCQKGHESVVATLLAFRTAF